MFTCVIYISTHNQVPCCNYYFEKLIYTWWIKKRKTLFIIMSLIPSSAVFLSLCRAEFLTYLISFSLKNPFEHFLQGRPTGNKFPQFLSEKVVNFFSLLKKNVTGSRILHWFFSSLNTLKLSPYPVLASIASQGLNEIFCLCFSIGKVFFLFSLDPSLYLRFPVTLR